MEKIIEINKKLECINKIKALLVWIDFTLYSSYKIVYHPKNNKYFLNLHILQKFNFFQTSYSVFTIIN